MELREITYLAVALRIFAAVLIGGLIGLERGMKNRAAGLRTYMLVCVGACLVMLTNQYIYQATQVGDPVRMGAQVVSGIGFLGAGTIIVTRHSQIKGLTTAAGLWSAAGVGLALGIGFYEAAITGAIAVFIIMTLMQRMDSKMHSKARRVEVYFELDSHVTLGDFLRAAHENEMEIADMQKEQEVGAESGVRTYTATIKIAKRRSKALIVADVANLPGVSYIHEL